jgi:CRP/FNR family transcriptional regulator, nitrogen fixation regulation protein
MGTFMITLSTARTRPSTAGIFGNFVANPEATSLAATLTDHLQAIQAYGARQHYQRNETVFNQGDTADQVYRILDGTVRLCRHMPDGRRYIVDFLLPGDVMGFVESPDQPVSAEAVTEISVIAFPRACFDQLARENSDMRQQLLCHMSASLQTAQQHLFVLGCQKANERVASFLLRLGDRLDVPCGARIDLTMSRQDIADHLGLTIETISRAITALRSAGIILVPNAHQLIVRDSIALRALAAEG